MFKKILGLDLSGKDGNPSGFCLIYGATVAVIGEFRTLKYLLEYLHKLRPDIVAVDSPLSTSKNKPYRDCDLLLKKDRMNPLPLNTPGMQQLIRRALLVTETLSKVGIKCIETFPAGALRMLGFKRKPRSYKERRKYFNTIRMMMGLRSMTRANKLTKDEFDAFVCAVAGYAFLIGRYVEYVGKNCRIILPKA